MPLLIHVDMTQASMQSPPPFPLVRHVEATIQHFHCFFPWCACVQLLVSKDGDFGMLPLSTADLIPVVLLPGMHVLLQFCNLVADQPRDVGSWNPDLLAVLEV